jgi:hypothetical protein
MKIALSKRDEAQVSLDRINYYIFQSQITAPYDGIVVEGDHTKLLGTPVNKGDVILKIAKMGSMFLKIYPDTIYSTTLTNHYLHWHSARMYHSHN